jgi:FkbM family methyltransferase
VISRTISVRGEKREFLLREGTSDMKVFEQTFAERKFDLRRLKLGRSNDLAYFVARRKQEIGKLPLVIDAGANIGASSMFFADHIPDALVLAVEPEAGNFALLKQNVDHAYVQPIQAAISSAPGRMRVLDPGSGHWSFQTERADDGTVGCLMINEIYAQTESRCFPFLVKVDIEGAEADLFGANTEWVAKTPLLIVELHDWMLPRTANSRPFLQCVSQLNRDFLYVGTEEIYSIANDL